METRNVYQAYFEELDITTIFEDISLDEKVISTEVKGFYFGEPNDDNMKEYYGKTKAKFSAPTP